MDVYRVYYGWYDCHDHIGIFFNQVNAWIACYEYYLKHLSFRVCWKHIDDDKLLGIYCNCKKHRLPNSRYKRLFIVKEVIQ